LLSRTASQAIFVFAVAAARLALMGETPGSADTPERRRAAAEAFIVAVPPSEEIDRLIRDISQQLAEARRDAFIEQMEQRIDMAYMKRVMIDGLVAELTVAELKAAAKFYGSPEGKAVREKLPKVIDSITPLIQSEVERTARKLLR